VPQRAAGGHHLPDAALNNLWVVEQLPGKPTYRLRVAHTGMCLNLDGGGQDSNTALVQYPCTSGATSLNEQVYLPPTASATAVTPAASPRLVSVIQGTSVGGKTAPIYYSWVLNVFSPEPTSSGNFLSVLTDFDPDGSEPGNQTPRQQTDGSQQYTGSPTLAKRADGRVQVNGRVAATGDVFLSDEIAPASAGGEQGNFAELYNLGAALGSNAVLAKINPAGALASFAITGGTLWYAPQQTNNPQAPYGAWRSLDGGTLTGTPAFTPTAGGVRVYALTTAGTVRTAELVGTTISDWTDLGAPTGATLTDTPSAVTLSDGRIALFARAGAQLVYKIQTAPGTWPATWTAIAGASPAGSPSAVVDPGNGALAVVFRGATDQTIWTAFEDTPGSGTFTPSPISDPVEDPAATDATAFAFDVPTGDSFGFAFLPSNRLNAAPVTYRFEPMTAAKATSAKNGTVRPADRKAFTNAAKKSSFTQAKPKLPASAK
jgi:hypothetical protein